MGEEVSRFRGKLNDNDDDDDDGDDNRTLFSPKLTYPFQNADPTRANRIRYKSH